MKLTVIRGNAAEPHVVEVVREEPAAATVSGKIVRPGVGLIRVAGFNDRTVAELKQQVAALTSRALTTSCSISAPPPKGPPSSASPRRGCSSGKVFWRAGRHDPSRNTISPRVRRRRHHDAHQPARRQRHVAGRGSLRGVAQGQQAGERSASTRWGARRHRNWWSCPTAAASGCRPRDTRRPTDIDSRKGLTPDTAVAEPDLEFGARRPPRSDSRQGARTHPSRLLRRPPDDRLDRAGTPVKSAPSA